MWLSTAVATDNAPCAHAAHCFLDILQMECLLNPAYNTDTRVSYVKSCTQHSQSVNLTCARGVLDAVAPLTFVPGETASSSRTPLFQSQYGFIQTY